MTDDELEAEYWGYSQYDDDEDCYDDDEDDYYFSDFDEWDGPDIYYCQICGEDESGEHEPHAHALHDNAERDLIPLMASHTCGIDGSPLEFHAYCPPDEFVLDEYALVVCRDCGEIHTILHTKNRAAIIAVYLGIGGHFAGVWSDSQTIEEYENVELPF
jgi:hypothetical protein